MYSVKFFSFKIKITKRILKRYTFNSLNNRNKMGRCLIKGYKALTYKYIKINYLNL